MEKLKNTKTVVNYYAIQLGWYGLAAVIVSFIALSAIDALDTSSIALIVLSVSVNVFIGTLLGTEVIKHIRRRHYIYKSDLVLFKKQGTDYVFKTIRRRAFRHRTTCWLILGLILFSIFTCVWIYINADTIIQESKKMKVQEEIKQLLEERKSTNKIDKGDIIHELFEARNNLDAFLQRIAQADTTTKRSSENSSLKKGTKTEVTDTRFGNKNSKPIKDKTHLELLNDSKESLDKLIESANFFTDEESRRILDTNEKIDALIRQLPSEQKEISYLNFSSTILTRVGSLIILVFLVQLLTSLYRYNARLASFYDSRSTAIAMLNGNSALTIEQALALTSTDNFDFGKKEKPDTEHLTAVAKAAVENAWKRT